MRVARGRRQRACTPTTSNTPRLLAIEDVKWAGEGVAMIVAETPEQAQDALELIEVD